MPITVDDPEALATEEWLLEQSFEPAFSDEDMRQIAERYDADEDTARQNYRAALAIMARSSAEIVDRSREDPEESAEAFFKVLEAVSSSVEQRRRELDLLESAQGRLHIVVAQICALESESD